MAIPRTPAAYGRKLKIDNISQNIPLCRAKKMIFEQKQDPLLAREWYSDFPNALTFIHLI